MERRPDVDEEPDTMIPGVQKSVQESESANADERTNELDEPVAPRSQYCGNLPSVA